MTNHLATLVSFESFETAEGKTAMNQKTVRLTAAEFSASRHLKAFF
jgi:hypothetical protein